MRSTNGRNVLPSEHTWRSARNRARGERSATPMRAPECVISPRRSSIADSHVSARSSSCRATGSITGCWHSPPYVGVIYAPIAPAYSLQARDYAALRLVFERMQPALVFAADGAAFERALSEVLPTGVELVTSTPPRALKSTSFADLEHTPITSAV